MWHQYVSHLIYMVPWAHVNVLTKGHIEQFSLFAGLTGRQTDRQTTRQTDRQTDRQTHTHYVMTYQGCSHKLVHKDSKIYCTLFTTTEAVNYTNKAGRGGGAPTTS